MKRNELIDTITKMLIELDKYRLENDYGDYHMVKQDDSTNMTDDEFVKTDDIGELIHFINTLRTK